MKVSGTICSKRKRFKVLLDKQHVYNIIMSGTDQRAEQPLPTMHMAYVREVTNELINNSIV